MNFRLMSSYTRISYQNALISCSCRCASNVQQTAHQLAIFARQMTKAKYKSQLKWQFTWSSGRSIILLIGCSSVEPVQDVEVAMIQSSSTPLQSNRPKHRLSSFSPSLYGGWVLGMLFSGVVLVADCQRCCTAWTSTQSPCRRTDSPIPSITSNYCCSITHTHSVQNNFTTTPSHSSPSFTIAMQAYS